MLTGTGYSPRLHFSKNQKSLTPPNAECYITDRWWRFNSSLLNPPIVLLEQSNYGLHVTLNRVLLKQGNIKVINISSLKGFCKKRRSPVCYKYFIPDGISPVILTNQKHRRCLIFIEFGGKQKIFPILN